MADSILAAPPERCFYVYILYRPDGRPCYVGKGRGERWRAHFKRTHNPHLRNIIRKYRERLAVSRIFVTSEAEAYEFERFLISLIGRKPAGPLVNQSDGGKGGSTGRKMSADEIQRRYQILSERGVIDRLRAFNNERGPVSIDTRAKMSAAQKARIVAQKAAGRKFGHMQSESERMKRSASLRLAYEEGRRKRPVSFPPMPIEVRRANGRAMRGRKHSEEAKRKMSASHKGLLPTAETLARRLAGTQKFWRENPEAKQRMSERIRRWWAERKAKSDTTPE